MNYTLIRLDHLDKTNATKIEADLDAVTYAELEHAKDTGTRAAAVSRDLHRGELFLISEAPRTPLFIKKECSLSLTNSHAVTLPQEAIQKASQRMMPAKHSAVGTGTTPSSDNLLPADESTTKTLEDIPTPQRKKYSPHYYNLEIACPASSVKTYAPGTFNLGGTDTEPKKALELKNAASDNAWYSVECTCDEAKRLFYKPNGSADSNLGVQSVSLSTTCDISAAKEAYIPVTPAVQVNERLGFPTTGYFYHFHGNVLIHEYKIDEGKCTFSITHSRADAIIDGVKFPKAQHSMLLFWRINGKTVNNQYLLYKKEQLTTTDLQKITEEWLQENGFEVDVDALLAARSEPITHSAVEDLPAEAPKKVQRYGNILYEYPIKKIAPDVLAAKKQTQPFDIAVCNVGKVPDSLFRKYFPKILGHEGGYSNDKFDRGGKTNKGITLVTFRHYAKPLLKIKPTTKNLKNLTDEQAYLIAKEYWNHVCGDEINDPELAYQITDFHFNSGYAVKILQQTIKSMGKNIVADNIFGSKTLEAINSLDSKQLYIRLRAARKNYYRRFCESDNSQKRFLKGWLNRCDTFNYY